MSQKFTKKKQSLDFYETNCHCCLLPTQQNIFPRRKFLSYFSSLFALGIIPSVSIAAEEDKEYDAMLLNCMDPRITTLSWQYMGLLSGVNREKLGDNYSHIAMAGGPIAAVHPKFAPWHSTFWDNLEISVEIHRIKRVVGLTHRDCGGAKLAFGAEGVLNKSIETESHGEALVAFRNEINSRHPKLSVITGIMSLSGRVELIG